MTLPCERTRAVLRAKDFLTRLSSAYLPNGLKGIRSEVRQEARDILRHFPHWFDIGRADCWDESEAMRCGNEDESEESVEWLKRPYYVDPPEGWRYGFPKLYRPGIDPPMNEWLVAKGYPKKRAKDCICTFTAATT